MIDYLSHLAVLQRVIAGLASVSELNASVMAARDQLLAEVKSEPRHATLGVFIDHLMTHAVSDGSEIALLEDAATLWAEGLSLYNRFGAARARMEGSLSDHNAPDALTRFNSALLELNELRDLSAAMGAKFESIRTRALKRKWLKEHPRQRDATIGSWDWGNLFLARRTDAFVRAVFARAKAPEERAFALGTLASYGGNVAGSAFLGHVVGGPRRAHRFRDRLARNAVGAWVSQNIPLPRLSDVAASIDFGGLLSLTTLPPDLGDLIRGALKDAYQRSDFPDLNLGYARTVRHLQLLDSFARPDLPAAPPVMFTMGGVGGVGDPGDMGGIYDGLDDPGTGGIGTGGGTTTTGTTTGADSQSKSGDLCLLIFAALITFGLVLLINCIVQWTTKDGPCEPFTFNPDAPPEAEDAAGTTKEGLTALAEGPGGGDIIQTMYGLHQLMWQAFDAAYSFLAVSGLIYPDAFLMGSPLYKQFLSVPTTVGYPRRPSTNDYIEFPNSGVEQPNALPSALPAGSSPFGFIYGLATQATDAWSMARPLWSQIAHHAVDSTNFDLDADRGFMHPCWRTKLGTSINNDPIQGENLAYTDI
jgi:hypothetical protein